MTNPMFSRLVPAAALERAGFRFGARGTHSARTIMLRDLTELLVAVPSGAAREEYAAAIVEENVLGKPTWVTRNVSRKYLTNLYGLDPGLPLFRVLRRLWEADPAGRPLVALMCTLARDPLLRSTAAHVLSLGDGEELLRAPFSAVIRVAVGARLNDSVVDSVASRAASSWTQSGHLKGHRRKRRRRVATTPGAAAMALWLGELQGLAGLSLLDSDWAAVLDLAGPTMLDLALEARRHGLIHARAAGSVVEIDTRRLDPAVER